MQFSLEMSWLHMCPVARCRPCGTNWLVLNYLLIAVPNGLSPDGSDVERLGPGE